MSGNPAARLSRLLSLVPYFQAHPGIAKADAARDLGITVKQLEKDLGLLWLCGLPGHGGGDLIDVSFHGATVDVSESQGMDRPLRLTYDEATAVLLALSLVADQQSSLEPSAARTAMAKIEQAAGAYPRRVGSAAAATTAAAEEPENAATHPRRSATPDRTPEGPHTETIAEQLGRGLSAGRSIRIQYYSASRDVVSTRIVDPIRIQIVSGNSYLEAWCRQAEATRFFLFDRIDAVEILDEPATPPAVPPTDALGDFTADDSVLPRALLRITGDHRWVPDYFPMEQIAEHDDGSIDVALRYAGDGWLIRLLVGFGGGVRLLGDVDYADRTDSPHSADDVGTGGSSPRPADVRRWCREARDAYARAAEELEDIR